MTRNLGPFVKTLLLSAIFFCAQAFGQSSTPGKSTPNKSTPGQTTISKLRAIKSPDQRVVEIDKLFASRDAATGLQINVRDLTELREQTCSSPSTNCEKQLSWVRAAASEKTLNDDLITWMQVVPLSLSKGGFDNFKLETKKLSLENSQLGFRSQILFHYAIERRKNTGPNTDIASLTFTFNGKEELDSQSTSFFKHVASEISTPHSTRAAATEMLMNSVLSGFNPENSEEVEIIPWLMRTLMIDLNRPDLVISTFAEIKKHSAKLPKTSIVTALEIFCIAARATLASQSCLDEATQLSALSPSMATAHSLDTNNLAEVEKLLKKERWVLPLISELVNEQNLWMLYYASQYYRLKNDLKYASMYIEAFRKIGVNDPFVTTFYEIEISRILRLQDNLTDSTYNLALAQRRANQLWGNRSFVSLLVKIEFLKNLSLTKKNQDATALRTEILEEITNKPSLALYKDAIALIDKMTTSKSIVSAGKRHPDLVDIEMISRAQFKKKN